MTVAFGSVSTNTRVQNSAALGTLTINVPAGVANGDFMLMALHTASGSGSQVYSGTLTGWTVIEQPVNNTGGQCAFLAWRIASSEPASYTVTPIAACFDQVGAIWRYTGSNGIIRVHSSNSTGTSGTTTSPTPSALAGVQPTDLSIRAYGGWAAVAGTFTAPGGWTTRASFKSAGTSASAGMLIVDLAGSTATPTASNSAALTWAHVAAAVEDLPVATSTGWFDMFE